MTAATLGGPDAARVPALSGGADVPATPLTAAAIDPPASALAEEVQSAFEYMPATLAGMVAGAGVVLLLFWTLVPAAVLAPWLGAFGALWLIRLAMLQRYRRALRKGPPDWQAWRRVWNLATLVSGEVTYRDGKPTGTLPGRLVRRGKLEQAVRA